MVKRPVFKKSLVILTVFLLLFQVLGGISPVYAEGDFSAPEVKSLEVSPGEVQAGDEVTVTADIIDESGVKYATAVFKLPAGDRDLSISLYLNEETGLYEGKYIVGSSDAGGVWAFSYIGVTDTIGNRKNFYPKDFENPIEFTILNPDGDSKAPEVKSLEVSPGEVQVGDEVIVRADISDESGVKYATSVFELPSGDRDLSISLYRNEKTGLYEGKYTVGPSDAGGVWEFSYIGVTDKIGNRKNFYPKDFSNPIEFTILNPDGDAKAPEVKSLQVSPGEVQVGDEVIVTADISDESGVKYATTVFDLPSGDRDLSISLYLNEETGLYEGKYRIKSSDSDGIWAFSYMGVTDQIGNRKNYYPKNFPEESTLKFIKHSSDSDIDNVLLNHPDSDYLITTKHEVWMNKTIDKDLYIGPNSTITVADNVTLTGDVYVYGTLISHGGLTIQGDLNAKSVTYGSNSSALPGAVRIVRGNNSIRSTIVSNQPYDVPFKIYNENLTNETKTAVLEGKTLPFLDVSFKGNPISLEVDGSFKVTADDLTSEGLQFTLIDVFGNQMVKDVAVKDVLPPASVSDFKISKVTNNEVQVSWTANKESDLKEYMLYVNGELAAKAPSSAKGYSFTKLKEGTPYELSIIAVDQAGNQSGVVKVNETTLLSKPVINPVSEKDALITGQAYPGTLITVYKAKAEIGAGTTDQAGNYKIDIEPQKAGTELSVVASNQAGIVSDEAKVTVEDKTAPAVPTVKVVTDQSTTVAGTGEADSIITIESDGTELASGKADRNGNFSIAIAKQIAGTKLQIFSTDAAGNVSEAKTVTVIDVTKPVKPKVDAVPENAVSVSGTAEAGAKITVKTGNTILNTGTAGKDGKFSIAITKQKVGTVITVTATDQAGNISEATETTVFDSLAPIISLTNKVTSHSTRIIGTSEAGAVVTVKAGTKTIGTATADAKGNYEITIEKQKAGAKLTIVASDASKNNSNPITITVTDGNYPDLKVTHWALDEIMYLGDDQIIGGYPNGKFEPEKKTTRAEAAKMLSVALDLPTPDTTSGYKDVSSKHWAKNYVAAVSKAGLFNGNPDGTFAPDKTLKRSEMAKIISIAYDLKAGGSNHFNDIKSSHWAKGYISGLYENGITTGYPDQTFRPEEPTTRAEYSVFLARALNEDFR